MGFLHNRFGDIVIAALLLSTAAHAERRVTTRDGNAAGGGRPFPADLRVPDEWQTLLDPRRDEFWFEGQHRPDAGFLLWAKNPTIDNARLYLIRMNLKRDRVHLMQEQQEAANKSLVAQGAIADDYDYLSKVTSLPKKEKGAVIEDAHVFFIFTSTCPHCQRQAAILKGQPNITPMQAGGDKLVDFEGLSPSSWATKEDLAKYAPDKVVPVLLVYSNLTNNMVALKGVHSLTELQKVASSLKAKGK